MALYAILLLIIRHRFLGNEYVTAKSYLYIAGVIILSGLIFITILNLKMML